jgi:hypothetical protein
MSAILACEALRTGHRLELQYNGSLRIVEVHAVGLTSDNRPIMSAYQIRGGSVSGDRVGWKTMDLDKALFARLTDEVSEAPRAGYKRNAHFFQSVRCQL